jgi:LPXTG-site transpeptidase (sortase) family protein
MTKAQPRTKIFSFFVIGIALINAGLMGLVLIYTPIIYQELNYVNHQRQLAQLSAQVVEKEEPIVRSFTPVNKQFSVIIPKLDVNAPVIANVDPFDEAVYHAALKQGVAHAHNSALPNEMGTTFLFAHSTASLLDVEQFNAIFYLLNKLQAGDKVWLVYKNDYFEYTVSQAREVMPSEIGYLNQEKEQLLLMTCSPPGTDLRRLIVFAEPS